MISLYGAPPFLNSNTSHLLIALCPGINTSCFPSCSMATPRKHCCISEELLLLIWKKRPSLCLLCCHITCSHAEDRSVATAVWLPSICITHRLLDFNSKIRGRISGAQHPHSDQTSQRYELFKGLQNTDQLYTSVLLWWPLYTKKAELCGKSGHIFGRTRAEKLNPPITHIWIPFP